MLMKSTPELNFINVLRTAFTEPKSVKKTVNISLFTLSGSTSIKAERKCVDEIVKLQFVPIFRKKKNRKLSVLIMTS